MSVSARAFFGVSVQVAERELPAAAWRGVGDWIGLGLCRELFGCDSELRPALHMRGGRWKVTYLHAYLPTCLPASQSMQFWLCWLARVSSFPLPLPPFGSVGSPDLDFLRTGGEGREKGGSLNLVCVGFGCGVSWLKADGWNGGGIK